MWRFSQAASEVPKLQTAWSDGYLHAHMRGSDTNECSEAALMHVRMHSTTADTGRSAGNMPVAYDEADDDTLLIFQIPEALALWHPRLAQQVPPRPRTKPLHIAAPTNQSYEIPPQAPAAQTAAAQPLMSRWRSRWPSPSIPQKHMLAQHFIKITAKLRLLWLADDCKRGHSQC